MKYNKKDLKIFNLSKKDTKVLEALNNKRSEKVINIAKQINIPRTTVKFLLLNLQKRGLVDRIKINNHLEWKVVPDDQLVKTFHNLINQSEHLSKMVGSIEGKTLNIQIFQGKEILLQLIDQVLKFGSQDRIYAIQSNQSAKYQLFENKNRFRKLIFDFHQEMKKKKFIMEAICSESILSYFNDLDIKELKSHLNRLIIAHLLPNKYINFPADIILHKKYVMLINYKDENLIIIKNEIISQIFLSLFEMIKYKARKVDLNAYIRELIEEKNRT